MNDPRNTPDFLWCRGADVLLWVSRGVSKPDQWERVRAGYALLPQRATTDELHRFRKWARTWGAFTECYDGHHPIAGADLDAPAESYE